MLRCHDFAADAGCAANAAVKRQERRVEELREGDVAGVVRCQIPAELPRSGRQEVVGPLLDGQVEQVGMRLVSLIRGDESGEFVAPDDVGCLEREQGWRCEIDSGENLGGPATIRSCIQEDSNHC